MKTFPWQQVRRGLAIMAVGALMTQMPRMTAAGVLTLICGLAWAAVPKTRAPRWAVLYNLFAITAGTFVLALPWPTVHSYGWWTMIAGVLGMAATVFITVRRWNSTSAVIGRWNAAHTRTGGTVSWWQWYNTSREGAVRRRIKTLMPSSKALSWLERRRVPITRFGYYLGREGKRRMWAGVEDHHGIIGGPRRGKTGSLACLVVDACGAVVTTSTREDIIDITAPMRREKGPLYVVNTTGSGRWNGRESGVIPVRFSPLWGCTDKAVADERATDMIPLRGSGDGARWDALARAALAVLMHAAALARTNMHQVEMWRATITDPATHSQVYAALNGSRTRNAVQAQAKALFNTNPNTLTSVTNAMGAALLWLSNPAAAAVGGGVATEGFDVAQFLAKKGTLYLIGKGQAGGLIGALTGEVARQAYRIADRAGGRLDPGFRLVLDEVGLICPVPLDQWTADFGGRNIDIHWCLQSMAALKAVYGDTAASIILNNTTAVHLMGGTKDSADLQTWSALAGQVDVHVATMAGATSQVASSSTRKDSSINPTMLATLPKAKAVLFHSEQSPAVVTLTMAWNRRDIRKATAASGQSRLLDQLEADTSSEDFDEEDGYDELAARRSRVRAA